MASTIAGIDHAGIVVTDADSGIEISTTIVALNREYSKANREVALRFLKGVESALSLAAETNPKAQNRKPDEFIDASFMEELERSGFIKSVWR